MVTSASKTLLLPVNAHYPPLGCPAWAAPPGPEALQNLLCITGRSSSTLGIGLVAHLEMGRQARPQHPEHYVLLLAARLGLLCQAQPLRSPAMHDTGIRTPQKNLPPSEHLQTVHSWLFPSSVLLTVMDHAGLVFCSACQHSAESSLRKRKRAVLPWLLVACFPVPASGMPVDRCSHV